MTSGDLRSVRSHGGGCCGLDCANFKSVCELRQDCTFGRLYSAVLEGTHDGVWPVPKKGTGQGGLLVIAVSRSVFFAQFRMVHTFVAVLAQGRRTLSFSHCAHIAVQTGSLS